VAGEACVRLRSSREIRQRGPSVTPCIQGLRLLRSRTQVSPAATGTESGARLIPDQNHLTFLIAIKQLSTLRFLSWTRLAKRKRPCQTPSPKAWPGIFTLGEASSSS